MIKTEFININCHLLADSLFSVKVDPKVKVLSNWTS